MLNRFLTYFRNSMISKVSMSLASALLLASLGACTNDENEPEHVDGNLMKFQFSLPAASRATETNFENGDKVGVFVTNSTSHLEIGGNLFNNEEITFTNGEWNATHTLRWSEGKYNVYAYYPRLENIASTTDLPFTVRTDQRTDNGGKGFELSDFLYASMAGVEASSDPLNMQFRHIMSKLAIRLIPGEDFHGEFPETSTVYIHNIYNKAFIDMEEGVVTKDGYSETSTTIARRESNNRFSAIVVPQRMDNRAPFIELVMNGISYMYEAKFLFKPGIQHTVNLVVSKNPDEIKIEIGGEMQSWN